MSFHGTNGRVVPLTFAEGLARSRTTSLTVIGERAPSSKCGFSGMACGSVAELETQFLPGQALGYTDEELSLRLLAALAEVERLLAALSESRATGVFAAVRLGPHPHP